ncbi:MAG: tetratricopeptide repeat protein, partial [Rhodoferax sp.]
MRRVKLSVVCTSVLTAGALLLAACSSTPVDKTATMSAAAVYADAKDEMSSGQWDKAIPLLEKLEAKAAGTPLAQQAQLDKAYAQYKT